MRDEGRPQKLFVVNPQTDSARIIASFTPPGARRVEGDKGGGGGGAWSEALVEGEVAFEAIETGMVLGAGTIVSMTRNAAWLDLGVRRVGSKGRLYNVNGRIAKERLPPNAALAAQSVRGRRDGRAGLHPIPPYITPSLAQALPQPSLAHLRPTFTPP